MPSTSNDPTVLRPGDLEAVGGPLEGATVALPDGAVTDVAVAGPDDGATVLLVCGLGQHRTDWPPELLARLHDAGYRTVCADNRDAGRATVLGGGLEDLPAGEDGWPVPPYGLDTIAADLVAVLDHLDVSRAHVLGVSMGGMLAQHVAFAHADRVASLISVMSTTGARAVGGPAEAAKPVLTTMAPTDDVATYTDHVVAMQHLIGSPGHVEVERVRARARVKWVRGLSSVGTARQLLAIRTDGDRTDRLAGVRAPTLVLHGEDDPLIDVSGGHATAAAIDGAQLVTVAGWGHDLPVSLLDRVTSPVLAHLGAHAS